MSLFSRQLTFPGVELRPDGSIDFTLTTEEARAADSALSKFAGYRVHPDYVERIRNGTIAVALSHYARELVQSHLSEITAANGKPSQSIQILLQKPSLQSGSLRVCVRYPYSFFIEQAS